MQAMSLPRQIRFLVAGCANTALGLSLYPLLLWCSPWLHQHYLVALGVAQVVCLLFAFATYKLGVFRTKGFAAREFGAFSTYYLFNYAANWAVLPALVEIGRIPPILAQTLFTLLLVAGSWFWHSRITFRGGGGQ